MYTITNNEFRQMADYIKMNFGIHLTDEKRVLLEGRLSKVLNELNIKNFSDYYKYVTSDRSGEAVNTLINKISTNHTFFMREVNHFHFLKEKVFPTLLPTIKDKDLRIWSAGCSSGEEPYTLAFLVDEYLNFEKWTWDAKILATDISADALNTAKKGIYGKDMIASLPKQWKSTYFMNHQNEKFEVKSEIKKEIIFRRFNLMEKAFPFKKKFHVIFCRNVMIYFDHKTKMELIEKFYEYLEPGGYLFIGHSETIDREYRKFKYIMPAVYQK
ncbi:CheR family methyltransferase [Pseudoneobacillus sp. C159]